MLPLRNGLMTDTLEMTSDDTGLCASGDMLSKEGLSKFRSILRISSSSMRVFGASSVLVLTKNGAQKILEFLKSQKIIDHVDGLMFEDFA